MTSAWRPYTSAVDSSDIVVVVAAVVDLGNIAFAAFASVGSGQGQTDVGQCPTYSSRGQTDVAAAVKTVAA